MKVIIDSIEISGTNRYGRIEADIEFNDTAEMLQELGLKECMNAFENDDFLAEIGWEEVKKYFADEIQEERNEAFKEGRKEDDSSK